MPGPAVLVIETLMTLSTGSGSVLAPAMATTALRCTPPTLPPPEITTLSNSIYEFGLKPRSLPQG